MLEKVSFFVFNWNFYFHTAAGSQGQWFAASQGAVVCCCLFPQMDLNRRVVPEVFLLMYSYARLPVFPGFHRSVNFLSRLRTCRSPRPSTSPGWASTRDS
jgi:hypothetical protein